MPSMPSTSKIWMCEGMGCVCEWSGPAAARHHTSSRRSRLSRAGPAVESVVREPPTPTVKILGSQSSHSQAATRCRSESFANWVLVCRQSEAEVRAVAMASKAGGDAQSFQLRNNMDAVVLDVSR
eukprot:3939754-Rhodomonas_salina.4